jgi:hypothetical protein
MKPVPFPVEESRKSERPPAKCAGLKWRTSKLEVLIKCPNEAAQEKLLELNGWDCPRGTLKVRWAIRRLTVAEI